MPFVSEEELEEELTFHKDTTEYNVTLPSNVAKINIDPLSSDTGGSYCISVSHYNILSRERRYCQQNENTTV
jgi:hypothetical protein